MWRRTLRQPEGSPFTIHRESWRCVWPPARSAEGQRCAAAADREVGGGVEEVGGGGDVLKEQHHCGMNALVDPAAVIFRGANWPTR